jgi:hypothetical protein
MGVAWVLSVPLIVVEYLSHFHDNHHSTLFPGLVQEKGEKEILLTKSIALYKSKR